MSSPPREEGAGGNGVSRSPRFLSRRGAEEGASMPDWPAGEARPLRLETLGESYRRYRLPDPEGDGAMTRSLARYGQLAPIVVWLAEETPEVLDGFKRLAGARRLGWPSLSA